MMKIKKGLFFKIAAICVSTCIFVDTIAYAAPALRLNLMFDGVNKQQSRERADQARETIASVTTFHETQESSQDGSQFISIEDIIKFYNQTELTENPPVLKNTAINQTFIYLKDGIW